MSLERDVTFARDLKPISPKSPGKDDVRKPSIKKKKVSKQVVVSEVLTIAEAELIQACLEANVDQIYQLMWKGTNPNCKQPGTGYTPLAIACKNGNYSVASILLAFGASPKVTDDYGVSPLHWASNHQDSNLVKLLLSKGQISLTDVSAQDNFGSTPLHFASVRNVTSTIQNGSDASLMNNNNMKPSDVTVDDMLKNMLLDEETRLAEEQIKQEQRQEALQRAKSTKSSLKLNSKRTLSTKSFASSKSGSMAKLPKKPMVSEKQSKPKGFISVA